MSTARATRLDLPVLLPDVGDLRDDCITRLLEELRASPGVIAAHVMQAGDAHPADAEGIEGPVEGPTLCLHYDPERVPLSALHGMASRAGAAISQRFAHALIPLRLVGTEDEGLRLEAMLRGTAGVTAASVNIAAQVARVEFDRSLTSRQVLDDVLADASARPRVAPASWYVAHRELVWSLASGVCLGCGWLSGRMVPASWLSLPLYVAAYAFGARDNVVHFVHDLRRGRLRFDIDLLMVVAALGAAMLGQWAEGGLLLFLFSLGHALEHAALGRARRAISALAELAPERAIIVRERNGLREEETVAMAVVKPGDVVRVRPAERVPVDGTVIEGRSAVNQAPITGESVPVDKEVGDTVFAGTVNGEGALLIEVTAAVGDRTLDRVITLVSEAQTQKAPTQQFTDRFERLFVPLVLVGDLLLIVVPPVLGILTWSEAFARAMAVLVAASPCALALGTPAAVLTGIAQAARNGVLIKGGAFLEALATVQSVALDKTGTITAGTPAVTDVMAMSGVTEEVLLSHAAAVESSSQHPLARAVVQHATARALSIPMATDVIAVTSRGIRATVNGATVDVGRALLFEDDGVDVPDEVRQAVVRLEQAGRSTMIVRRRGGTPEFLGVLGLADEPRANVRDTLQALRRSGVQRIVMLTGDNSGVANAIAAKVGVDDVRAGLLPEDKVTAIKALAAKGAVAMVGDGVNDAPALAHATVGIAMGGAGTAAALETADVALMGDDLSRLPFAIALSRQASRVIRQNLYISLGVIALLLVATLFGAATIGPAIIVHEGSTLIVIANALRLLRFREQTRS
jgi:Cd2+/Zn2+-exporting ATPase